LRYFFNYNYNKSMKLWTILLLISVTISAVEILKSPSDNRLYKHITLENKLEVLLISDSEADLSATSLDINIGTTSDPRPFFGTAHFLEHMLFVGTEKYPDVNDYNNFLSAHGGSSNAYTG
jgi:insulysin